MVVTPAPSGVPPVGMRAPGAMPEAAATPPMVRDSDEPSPRELGQKMRAEEDPAERGLLVSELWEIGTPEAVEILRQQFHIERDTDVKADIITGLVGEQKLETREVRFGILASALAPTQPADVRLVALELAGEFEDARAVALLQNLLQDRDEEVREAAQDAIELLREKNLR